MRRPGRRYGWRGAPLVITSVSSSSDSDACRPSERAKASSPLPSDIVIRLTRPPRVKSGVPSLLAVRQHFTITESTIVVEPGEYLENVEAAFPEECLCMTA